MPFTINGATPTDAKQATLWLSGVKSQLYMEGFWPYLAEQYAGGELDASYDPAGPCLRLDAKTKEQVRATSMHGYTHASHCRMIS